MQVPTEVDCVGSPYILDYRIKHVQCRKLAWRWDLEMVRMPTQRDNIENLKKGMGLLISVDALAKKRRVGTRLTLWM